MHTVTLIPGDGIGPEISKVVQQVFAAAQAPIEWEVCYGGQGGIDRMGVPLPEDTLQSIRKNGLALKGPLTTQIGTGYRSINVTLRQHFDLYCNLRPVRSLTGVKSKFEGVDLVIFRENTEDLYAGIEHKVGQDAAESIKIITRKASMRIVEAAFQYAVEYRRKKITAIHKANIMKLSDGLFLECAREIAAKYPQIGYEETIVDNMCMQLVLKPESYDVLVAPNLYGDILSDLCAGLVGGLGIVPGANIGQECAIFEAVHGTAPDIAGQDRANPVALLFSAILLLRHINEAALADKIQNAVEAVLGEGRFLTPDLGGTATTSTMAAAIISKL